MGRRDGEHDVDPDDWEALGEHGHALAAIISDQDDYAHDAVASDDEHASDDESSAGVKRRNRPAVKAGLKPSGVASGATSSVEEMIFHVAASSTVIHRSPYCPKIRGNRNADVEVDTFEVRLSNPFCARRGPCETCLKEPTLRSRIEETLRRLHHR